MLRKLVPKGPLAPTGEIVLSSNASNSTIASLALAVAVVTLLGLVLLILMFVLSSGPLGTLNDVTIIIAAWLSVALAWSLHSQHAARNPQLAAVALILTIVGAIIATYGSVLVISGRTGFLLAGLYMMVGNALIGVWLISLNRGASWPQGLIVLGLIAGAVMALGLAAIPGIVAQTDSFSASSWLTWVGQMGFFGWAILYPIWCLRLWALLRLG
jgi:hypothetical protein